MDLQEAVGSLFERPFSAEDRKILLDVVKNDAPELLQPTAIRRINREIWERMLTKFNTTANREWNVRQFKMCLQHLVRKTMQRKGGSQAQMLVSRRLQVHRFTSSEKKLLTNLVKDHLVLFSKQKDGDTIMAKRKGWTTMMWEFNRAPGIEGQRTAREIKTCVMNMLNRSKNKDVLELKALITAMNESEMGPDDAEACTEVQILSVQEEPRESIPSIRPSLQSSMAMSRPNQFILPQQSLLQTSHPSTQILAAMQQKMNRAPPNPMSIPTNTIPFSTPGEAQNIFGLQVSSAPPLHLASGIYPHTLTAVQGHHPSSSTITQGPEANLVPVAITAMTSRGDESFNRSDSSVQVIEIKDEVVSDDADEQFQGATHTESQNVTQLEKVRKDIPSFTEPTSKNGLSNIQIRIHEQRMVSPRQSAITPPGQRISSAEDSDTSYSTTHSFTRGDTGQSSYLQQSPEQTPRQSMVSEGRGSRGEAHNSAGVIEKRPVGIMGPKRAMGRREPSPNRNHQVHSDLQEVQRGPSRSQDPQSVHRQQGAAGSSRSLVGGSPRKESLGKMKRRLLQEQHDVRISLMREEHAWHLEEHTWKREEHELRMSMIRINSKI